MGFRPLCREAVEVFSSPSQLRNVILADLNKPMVFDGLDSSLISTSSCSFYKISGTISGPWNWYQLNLHQIQLISTSLMLYSFFQFSSQVQLLFTLLEVSHQYWLMVFHWSMSDSKSPQVSRTLLSIMAHLRYAVIWIVSTRLPSSKSSRPFNNPLVIVSKAPITIGTLVPFMFNSFFLQGRGTYTSFHILSVLFCGQPGQRTLQFCKFFFLLITIRSGLLAEIRWSMCMSKSHRSLCVSPPRTAAGLNIYHLFVWSN